MDLAGHGQSGDGREDWTVESLGGDVQAVIEELDLEQVIVVGHSMGGYVGLEVAHRMPGTVVAVVGVDTLHDAEKTVSPEELDAALTSFEEDWDGTMGRMLPSMLSPETDEEVAIWILDRADAAHQEPALALLRRFPELDLKQLFRDAGVPVRCINSVPGKAPANHATEIGNNRRYADFDAVFIERVGHYPMLERPGTFNVKLAEVLADIMSE
jgi:pimeloyl-ACP methyl ester carboxylesterase